MPNSPWEQKPFPITVSRLEYRLLFHDLPSPSRIPYFALHVALIGDTTSELFQIDN